MKKQEGAHTSLSPTLETLRIDPAVVERHLAAAVPALQMIAPEKARDDREGGVQVAFVPPDTRHVGKSLVAAIVLVSETDARGVVVKALPGDGLKVENADASGVLYRGDLHSQRRTTVAARVVASRPGTHNLRIVLTSDTPAVSADMEVDLPGFTRARPPETPEIEVDAGEAHDVSLVFSETDIRDALRAVADRGRVRVSLGPGVGGRRVSAYFQRVPAEAALRILADEVGYELTRHNGGFNVTER